MSNRRSTRALIAAGLWACLHLGAGCSSSDPSGTPDAGLPAADIRGNSSDGARDSRRIDGAVAPADGASTVPPANQTCAQAAPLLLSGGKGQVSGDTLLASNEFAEQIGCQGQMGPWKGPQVYYRVTLGKGKTYRVKLMPQKWDAALYVFPAAAGCDAAAINKACAASWRDTPDLVPYAGNVEELLLIPAADGDWLLVVDSFSEVESGSFTLGVEEYSLPGTTTCAKAEQLTLVPGKPLVVTGDTIGAPNELANLTCGEKPAKPGDPVKPYIGPQLYYKVELTAGVKYRLGLKPDFAARLYLFSATASCVESAIQADCSSSGATGAVLAVAMGASADLYFTPSKTGVYVIAVDSVNAMLYGAFTLQLSEYTIPTLTAPLTLDFEQGCAGLAATGDWDCGAITGWKPGPNCTLGSKTFGVPPPAGHSGAGMWGTGMHDCYNALGNNGTVDAKQGVCTNTKPDSNSILRFKVALPATWKTATLTYWSWEDVNSPYDWAEVRVNKGVVFQLCSLAYQQPTAWVKRTLDLSSYVGQDPEVSFHFMASTAVNYAGWYIDDLVVSGS